MTRARLLLLLAGLGPGVCACGYTPKQLGITGPGTGQTSVASHASEADTDAVIADPGIPTGFGTPFENSISPSGFSGPFGNSLAPGEDQSRRFFGYN